MKKIMDKISKKHLKSKVKNSNKGKEIKWNEVIPISFKKVEVKKLTRDMLPSVFGKFVFDFSISMNNTKPDFTAVSIITAAASVIGGSSVITPKAKNKGWKVKPTIWAMVIGNPSSYKTPSINKGVSGLQNAQKNYIDLINGVEVNRYELFREEYESELNELENKAKNAFIEEDLDQSIEISKRIEELKNRKPKKREIIVNDATPEALLLRLGDNPDGILSISDELNKMFMGMKKTGREQERSLYLEGYNASDSPYIQDRIGRERVYVSSVHINIVGGIQPNVLKPIIVDRKQGKADDGLFERFQLAVYPDCSYQQYVDKEEDPKSQEKVNKIFIHLAQLGYHNRQIYNFTPEAQVLWDEWSKKFYKELPKLSDSEQSIENKYPALLAKLSLIFHLVVEAESCDSKEFNPCNEIGKNSFIMAEKWLNYLRSHSKKILAIADGKDEYDIDYSVINLKKNLNKLNDGFTKQQLGTKDWSHLTKSEDRNRALAVLEQHGYIKLVNKPSRKYFIHPDYKSK
ncbi:DUF3987 domain-containing protein [Photobacterium lutimaris]|nr:DUF3987 domain-containing protein [Photobacterium lutimaris]